MLFVFFLKQRTAYEMRISDWSSDVCSSDLEAIGSSTEISGLFFRYRRGLGRSGLLLRSADQCKAVLMGNGEYDPAIRLLQDISMVAVIEPRHDDMATLYQPDACLAASPDARQRFSHPRPCRIGKHPGFGCYPVR